MQQPRLLATWGHVLAEVKKARKGSGPANAAMAQRLAHEVTPEAVVVTVARADAWWWTSARFVADHRADLEDAVGAVYALPTRWVFEEGVAA